MSYDDQAERAHQAEEAARQAEAQRQQAEAELARHGNAVSNIR